MFHSPKTGKKVEKARIIVCYCLVKMSVALLGLEISRIREAVVILIPRNRGVGVIMHELCGKHAKPIHHPPPVVMYNLSHSRRKA